jgi:catechol 2,3-dioxygenase-like lactoylglutathione lyase family enzyme
MAMASVEFTGIRHVKLPASDLTRSREWYQRVLGYTVEWEFPDGDGVVRGVGGRLPGAGVLVGLRQNAQAAAGNAGFDPVGFAIADRAAAEAWIAHFDALGVRHSGIRNATPRDQPGRRGWAVDVYDPDGLTVRLYSTGHDAEDHTNQPGYSRTLTAFQGVGPPTRTIGWQRSRRDAVRVTYVRNGRFFGLRHDRWRSGRWQKG